MVKQVKKGNFITRHLSIIWTQVLSDGVRGWGTCRYTGWGTVFHSTTFSRWWFAPSRRQRPATFRRMSSWGRRHRWSGPRACWCKAASRAPRRRKWGTRLELRRRRKCLGGRERVWRRGSTEGWSKCRRRKTAAELWCLARGQIESSCKFCLSLENYISVWPLEDACYRTYLTEPFYGAWQGANRKSFSEFRII